MKQILFTLLSLVLVTQINAQEPSTENKEDKMQEVVLGFNNTTRFRHQFIEKGVYTLS